MRVSSYGMFFVLMFQLGLVACSSIKEVAGPGYERNGFSLHKAWVRSTLNSENLGFRKINRSSPVIVGDMLIQGNSIDGLSAYTLSSGKLLWRVAITNGVEARLVQFKNQLFVPALDGSIYSIEASSGKINWSYKTASENLSEPLLDPESGRLYVLGGNNSFYALEADSGKPAWTYTRQDTSVFSIRGGSKPAIKDGRIYVGFSDGSLVALNSMTGNVLWDLQLNKNRRFRDIDATPVIDQDRLYVAGYDDRLYCVSTSKGEIIWKVDGGSFSGPVLQGDLIYYPTSTGEFLALKKDTGQKAWSYKLKDGVATAPSFYRGSVLFGESDGALVFLNTSNGKKIGEFEPGRGVFSAPVIDANNKRVYFISNEANLYALDILWKNSQLIPYIW